MREEEGYTPRRSEQAKPYDYDVLACMHTMDGRDTTGFGRRFKNLARMKSTVVLLLSCT